MPDDYEFVSDDWIVPTFPWPLMQKWLVNYDIYFATIRVKHDKLIEKGFTFFDFTGSSLGSDAQLTAHQDFYAIHNEFSDFQWTLWCNVEHHWFPQGIPALSMAADFHAMMYPTSFPHTWDDDKWLITTFALLIGSHREKFYAGWLQRVFSRYAQQRVAMVIENIFCMDNRGRPVE